MQVTETTNSGLKRELKVVIGAEELDNKLEARLVDLKDKVQIKGFRPGKVPVTHLRKMYGRSVMAEVLQETVTETSRSALTERDERPAFEPEITLTEDKEEIDQIMDGKADLAYTMAFEILPEIELEDMSSYKFEKLVAEVDEEEHQKGIDQVLEGRVDYAAVEREAQDKDRVTIDFIGRIDGEAFEGGTAEDTPVILGQGQFIPGFEEGLMGTKAGDEKDVTTTFPEEYQVETLAGKEAIFEVKVKEVAEPKTPELNDEFATSMGLENVDKFKDAVKEKLQEELDTVSKNRLKRELLDKLEESHKFELPEKLVTSEFDAIWGQLTTEMAQKDRSFEDEDTTEEEERKKYKDIAERRVRLGLIVSEIGSKNELKISDEEVQQALINKASQFPGQERQVLTFYQQNPQALAELRAPLFEEKVVDFIIELADVSEKIVSIDELTKFDEEENEGEAKE
ncbi:MAG: trigger factor [Rhizobiales bacterium]|nr:trigger factor [Hyphomicrobiales bacterium]